MKRLGFIAILMLIGFGRATRAQNLVSNHDFSTIQNCSANFPKISDWFIAPLKDTTKYGSVFSYGYYIYHPCKNSNQYYSFGHNFYPRGDSCYSFNLAYPDQGNGFVGVPLIDTLTDQRTSTAARGTPCRYSQVTTAFADHTVGRYSKASVGQPNLITGRYFWEQNLNQTLQKDTIYTVEMYIRKGTIPWAYIYTQHLGAYVSADTFYHGDYYRNNITPTLEAPRVIREEDKWVRIKDTFQANGNERFLTLGNFRSHTQYQLERPADTNGGAYSYGDHYFIDAVYLYKSRDTAFSVHLPDDTTLCADDKLTLAARHTQGFKLRDTAKTFLWSNGSTDSVTTVTGPGTYWVEVTYNHRYTARDTIVIDSIPGYAPGLPDTVEGCLEDSVVTLRAQPPGLNQTLLWSTGATTPVIEVSDSGRYTLTAATLCDTTVHNLWVRLDSCYADTSTSDTSGTDTTRKPTPQDLEVYIPDAFSPNGDGLNDTWRIINLPENNELSIYNRWGERIYRKKGYRGGWDGTGEDGALVQPGIYVYKLTITYPPGYKQPPGKTETRHGYVKVFVK